MSTALQNASIEPSCTVSHLVGGDVRHVVTCITRELEHDPVDNSIQDARIGWQAKVNPKRRGCFPWMTADVAINLRIKL